MLQDVIMPELTGECPNVTVCYKQKITFFTRNSTKFVRKLSLFAHFAASIMLKNFWPLPSYAKKVIMLELC